MQPEKKRLVFVDDERQILDSLRVALRRERKRWSMRFFADAEEALRALAEEPADLVVTDMRMPGIDGAEFLKRVSAQLPDSVRVVLSGQAEEALAVRAVPYAHQWIAKPTDTVDLVRVLDRALATRLLTHGGRAHEIVTSVATLPVLPQVYQQLTEALADPEVALDDICELVQLQPSVSARVLQMSNSAFFGLPRPMGSVREAVGFLGIDTIKSLVFAAEIVSELGPRAGRFPMSQFLLEATATSRLAAALMGPDGDEGQTALSAGLLHGIGRLVLIQAGDLGAEYSRSCTRQATDAQIQLEKQIFGATHAEVGAALLGVWGLPHRLVEAVAYHLDPDALGCTSMAPPVAVHVARAIVTHVVASESKDGAEREDLPAMSPGARCLVDRPTVEEFCSQARAALQLALGAESDAPTQTANSFPEAPGA